MTSRRPLWAAFLAMLVAVGCGSGTTVSAPASPDGGWGPGQEGGVASDSASGQDGADPTSIEDALAEAAPSDAAFDSTAAGGCSATSASSLPGVSIELRSPVVCTFTLAQAQAGISIPYDVVVASDVAGVVPAPQDAGGCGAPGNSGLIVFEQVTGGGQSYCLCDTGLCAPGPLPTVTLRAGTYAGAFSWTGRNWGGPSDTGNSMGAPFPPGSYALTVSARGTVGAASFVVTTTLTLKLVP